MPRVSIVIPVYNTAAYLDECLASLAAQTYGDFEAVCVDDGSTDESPQILDAWAARDARVRVIHKANAGVSAARNTGIEAARGDIVCFLDSDDRYVPHACERVVAAMDEIGAEVLTFGGSTIPADAMDQWLEHALSPRDAVYEQFSCDLLFKEASRPYPWRTACRRDLLMREGVRFDEGLSHGEDNVFAFAIYPRSAKTRLIADRLCEYRVGRAGSLMDSVANTPKEMLLEHVDVIDRVYRDWEDLGILDAHACEMLSWSVEFVLYDAMRLDEASCRQVNAAMAKVLLAHFDRGQIDAALAPRRASRAIVDNALDAGSVGRAKSLLLMSRYYAEHYGVVKFVKRALLRKL